MLTEYVTKVSQMPVFDYWIRKHPISTRLGTATNSFALRASQLLNERLAEKEASECSNRRDFISHLHEYQRKHPGQLSNTAFFGHVMTNLLVGSGSTSIAIRAVIYYVLRTPNVLSTLQAELDAAHLSYPVPWHASQDGLPYLDAVIKEAYPKDETSGFHVWAWPERLYREAYCIDGDVQAPSDAVCAL